MTVINTNVKSLVAQDAIMKNNRTLSTTMERLSTGKRINSAKDDAAGLAISTRMEAQSRGLTMAIKNANDGISLLQTAEGATDEVTNILQRMRELAVQSTNDTNNAQDRSAMNDEVKQLKLEIDRIASTTQFNNMNILDGSFKGKTLQIGDKASQIMEVKIASMKTKDLGMSPNSFGGDMLVSARISPAAVQAGDIEINGQTFGEIKATDDIEALVKNINQNVDNVNASGFNVVVAKAIGNGVTTNGQMQIQVQALGATALQATTFNITASNSMDELVANINAEANGLVKASINDTGRLVLSNDTGATISVNDMSGSNIGLFDGGSGFKETGVAGVFTGGEFKGFLKLESKDGSPVRVERGNYGQASPGTLTDLAALGFREVSSEPVKENYTATGVSLTAAGVTGKWDKTDISINGVEIFDTDLATGSFQGKLDAINNYTAETGVSASAYFEQTFDMTSVTFPSDQSVTVNGTQIQMGASLSAFATNLNAKTGNTGLVATVSGNNMTLSGANVQSVAIGHVDPNITTRLTSTVSAKGVDTAARTITIKDADVVVGRTIQIVARGDGGVTASSFAASYTIKTGDTKSSVAIALRNSILATATQVNGQTGYSGQRSALALTNSTGGVINFAAGASAYGDIDIELRTTEARLPDNSIVLSKVSNPGAVSNAAVTVTIDAADVVVGRTIQLNMFQGKTVSPLVGKDVSVSYTIQAGDTATKVASALVTAIENTASGMYAGRGSGFSGTAAEVGTAAGLITFTTPAGYGLSYGELSFIKRPLGSPETYFGAIRLDSVNNQPISIKLGDGATPAEHGLLEMNVGAADFEVNATSMDSSAGQAVSGLGVESKSAATKAISIIDNALETVSKSRSMLGAMENRLNSVINNLDNIVTNTEASKSRILDTDYAKETTSLARSQIIQQAATAMLAQANQAPQSVLALLK